MYYVRLMASVIPERPKIEGLVYWPLTDAEPNAWDPSDNNFYKMGCIRPNNLLSNGDIDYKPAGAVAASFFANTQWG